MMGTLASNLIASGGKDSLRFFEYGDKETDTLSERDEKLAEIIRKTGHIFEYADSDLYTSLVRTIIGQQISIPVYERTWAAFQERYGTVPDPATVIGRGKEEIVSLGIPNRRADYILNISAMFAEGRVDIPYLNSLSDEDLMDWLCSIKGIGPWTAEMVILFYFQRKDVFSYGDIALLRGLRMIYGLEEITPEIFGEFRKRFSPYCSVASLYIWEVGEGRIGGYTDPRVRKRSVR